MPEPSLNTGDANGILRRNNRGCKSKDFYDWPEQPFDDMDSTILYQQYIQQLVHRNPADIDEILRLPEGQDLGVWKVEHLRSFCMQLNRLAAKLQDCCHPETCNQMTATEQWIFLCAAHKQPNECPAIDYTRHTLDNAASLLNSNKYFPSRVTVKENSVAKLGSVCRRVYRIFSHAYYHHFQLFDEFERETHLCKRFSKFVTMYELMPKDSLIVPADGSKPIEQQTVSIAGSTEASSVGVGSDASSPQVTQTTAVLNEDVASTPKEVTHDDKIASSTPELTPVVESMGDTSKGSVNEPNNNVDAENPNAPESEDCKTTMPIVEDAKLARRQVPNTNDDSGAKTSWLPGQAHSTNTMIKGSSKIPTTVPGVGTDTQQKKQGTSAASASPNESKS